MSGDKIKMTYIETYGQEFVRPEYRVGLIELSTPEEAAAFVQGFYIATSGAIDLKADGKPV